MVELIEKYQEDKNCAPKQNERECPMTAITGQRLLSSFRAKVSASNILIMNQFESVM